MEDIVLKKSILDINFHPNRNIIVSGLINGRVQLFEYSNNNKSIMKINFHKKACRCVMFSNDGERLYTAGSDGLIAVFDINNQQLLNEFDEKMPAATHDSPINVLHWYDESLLISGDDNGIIKFWDNRQKPLVFKKAFEEHEDFIADMYSNTDKHHLLCAGGDGYLSVFDIRYMNNNNSISSSLYARSDNIEDELLSITVIKNGNKVICGSQDGVLQIFTYDDFGDISDRFPGHPQSIDAMVMIDQDTICTGSSDGLIRLVQIHPNKLLGVIGEHEDFPIEVIRKRLDNKLMASCSHDCRIKFWDIEYLYENDDDDDDDDVNMTPVVNDNIQLKSGTKADFYEDL